jgi:hypothetical protein
MKTERVSGPMLSLLFVLSLIACSDASGSKDPALDGSTPDTTAPGNDVPAALPDAPDAPDAPAQETHAPALDARSDAIPDGAATCLWPTAVRYTLRHFDFTVTAPDGTGYSRASIGVDAGVALASPIVGRVTDVEGYRFKVDSCVQGSSCQPTVYTFNVPSNVQLRIPVGKTVRVDWALLAPDTFSPGAASLSVLDNDPGTTNGNLLFAGMSGMMVSANARYSPDTLPFSATLQALNCKVPGADSGLASWGDDFAMVVTAKNGSGQTLKLATGETGTLEYSTQAGGTDRVRIHCLDAVLPAATDDYWNWDFWAETDLPMPDGGTP